MTSAAQRRAGADKGAEKSAEKSAHRAADKVPVYQVLAEDIKAMGVEAVFGLMSDDTALFATALDTSGVRFYGARHENTAIAMADGYAYATGRLGVAVVGRGPALANGLHARGLREPHRLVAAGDLRRGGDGRAAERARARLQGIRRRRRAEGGGTAHLLGDQPAVGAGGARRCGRGCHGRRLRSACTCRPTCSSPRSSGLPSRCSIQRPERTPAPAKPQSIAAAAAVLAKASRPLIVAGWAPIAPARARPSSAGRQDRRADRHHGARQGPVPRQSQCLGIIGSFSHSIARRMADQADCVLVFGAGLNFLTTSFGTSLPQVPLIQVDTVRSNIGRWLNADVAVVGDARLVAEQLIEALPERSGQGKALPRRGDAKLIAAFDPARDFKPANTARTLDPRTLALELEKLLPQDRNLVVDGGNFLGVVPYLSVPDPGAFKMIGEFASIGLGFGAALGVAKGRPDSTTVLVVGDGGFLMTMGELETVVREDLPMVIVLMNDCAYGAELHFLKLRQQPGRQVGVPGRRFRADRGGVGVRGRHHPHARGPEADGAQARQAGGADLPRLQDQRRCRGPLHERVRAFRGAALSGIAPG